jgi:hypothetical protein
MNDLALSAAFDLDAGRKLFDVISRLLETPCGPLGMASPFEATTELLATALQLCSQERKPGTGRKGVRTRRQMIVSVRRVAS